MASTRLLFAQEHEALGEARGVALTTQIVKLFLGKETPIEISKQLGISLDSVNEILLEAGLIEEAAQ